MRGQARVLNGSPVIGILEYAMALTPFGIVFLIGATLSARFEFLILLSAIGLAVVGTAVVGIAHGDRVGAVRAWLRAANRGLASQGV